MSKIDREWLTSTAASQIFSLVRNGEKLHNFGLLEKPGLPPPYSQYEELAFKVALIGSSFCGKTSFLESLFKSRPTTLLSESHPNQNYIETPGVQINHFFWPVKFVNSRFMIFDVAIWDVGKSSSLKYDYIKPSCDANLDCRCYMFSWADKQSFIEVYDQIKRIYFSNLSDEKKLPMVIVGTKFDQMVKSDIEPSLVVELESLVKKRVFRYSSLEPTFEQISRFMNHLCEVLWEARQNNSR